MGKAADNERAKLWATFYNNLAVGTALTGFIIPYLAIFGTTSSGPSILSVEIWRAMLTLLFAAGLTAFLRALAHSYAGQVKD